MRTYILTDADVLVLNEYVRGKRPYDGYVRSIVTRYKQNKDMIKMQVMLLDRVLAVREDNIISEEKVIK